MKTFAPWEKEKNELLMKWGSIMEKQWWKESVVYQIYPRSFMDSNGDGIGIFVVLFQS